MTPQKILAPSCGTLGLNVRNLYQICTKFAPISYETCMKFVRLLQFRPKFVRMSCALSANFTRMSRMVQNSYEIGTKFVRISKIQIPERTHPNGREIRACANFVNSCYVHVNGAKYSQPTNRVEHQMSRDLLCQVLAKIEPRNAHHGAELQVKHRKKLSNSRYPESPIQTAGSRRVHTASEQVGGIGGCRQSGKVATTPPMLGGSPLFQSGGRHQRWPTSGQGVDPATMHRGYTKVSAATYEDTTCNTRG